MTAKWQW